MDVLWRLSDDYKALGKRLEEAAEQAKLAQVQRQLPEWISGIKADFGEELYDALQLEWLQGYDHNEAQVHMLDPLDVRLSGWSGGLAVLGLVIDGRWAARYNIQGPDWAGSILKVKELFDECIEQTEKSRIRTLSIGVEDRIAKATTIDEAIAQLREAPSECLEAARAAMLKRIEAEEQRLQMEEDEAKKEAGLKSATEWRLAEIARRFQPFSYWRITYGVIDNEGEAATDFLWARDPLDCDGWCWQLHGGRVPNRDLKPPMVHTRVYHPVICEHCYAQTIEDVPVNLRVYMVEYFEIDGQRIPVGIEEGPSLVFPK